MKKYKIGYTQGTFDMFHMGHLNLMKQAKEQCERLIVGVNSDALVEEYKNKVPVICAADRAEIVRNMKAVDECMVVDTLDKVSIWNQIHFDAIFIGDDWKGDTRWRQTKKDLLPFGADVVYLKHTNGISSTMLRTIKSDKVSD